MITETVNLPPDFQQLLLDILVDECRLDIDALPVGLPCYELPIAPYFGELDDEINLWDDSDYRKAELFGWLIAHNITPLPPLVVSGGLLRDGYHRCYALRELGIDKFPAIVLDGLQLSRQEIGHV